ncbi:MAG: alanyl-tRNA editing protein [Nanoarchaeota archaeon]
MTQKLYLEDMYRQEFTAKVIAIEGNKVLLDQTCFFIQSCGQSGDCGELNSIRVLETQKGDWHLLAKEPTFKIGDMIPGKIDWSKRYPTMRLHSASHIVEHFLQKTSGPGKMLKTSVNHKRDLTDYTMPFPTLEAQQEITRCANELISKNTPILIETDEKGYRHWRCGEIQMGCGGTHVKNTSEIGVVQIMFEDKGGGIVRVTTTLQNP